MKLLGCADDVDIVVNAFTCPLAMVRKSGVFLDISTVERKERFRLSRILIEVGMRHFYDPAKISCCKIQ